MSRRWIFWLALIGMLAGSGVANGDIYKVGTAAYDGENYDLIYEDVQNLIWLDYTNTSDIFVNQKAWAEGLGSELTVTPLEGYAITWGGGWRLPETDESKADLDEDLGWEGPDTNGDHDYKYGYNMLNCEIGHLFYESLGNTGKLAKDATSETDYESTYGLEETGPFSHLEEQNYWSAIKDSSETGTVWFFGFAEGYQQAGPNDFSRLALAVRAGEVTAATVPGPATLLLLGSGLAGLCVFRKRIRP